ncbi:MAG: ABC transporter substrate-binding protein [Candidatus Micrarchaeia archaeon]|jgi:peptide/nickel transport system substrate-binding protein
MAKTKPNLKTKKNSDDLLLIAGILLLLVGSFIFFTYQGPDSGKTGNPTATPIASKPTATPTVKAALQGPAAEGMTFVNMTTDAAYAGLKDGSVDIFLGSLTPQQAIEAKGNPNIALYTAASQINALGFNPAPSANGTFNPFALQQVRLAMNYLIDRKAIVKNVHNGFGSVLITNINQVHPSYSAVKPTIDEYNITYNKAKALAMIDSAMTGAGAKKQDGFWAYNGKNASIIVLISETNADMKGIGEFTATALSGAGFAVNKQYLKKGDKTSPLDFDPAELKWNVDVGAWIYYSASKYEGVFFPSLDSKQGWYKYENKALENLYNRLSNVSSEAEWAEVNSQIARLALNDSIGMWVSASDTIFAARKQVKGLTEDNFIGLRSYANLRDAYAEDKKSLTIAANYLFDEGDSWNNMVIESISMMDVHNAITDPGVVSNPQTLKTQPYRLGYKIETAEKLDVPADAVVWNTSANVWQPVGKNASATSKTTYDLSKYVGTKWHHNATITLADVLYFVSSVWDSSLDAQKNETAALNFGNYLSTVRGIKIVGNTIEVYEDSTGFTDDAYLSFERFFRRAMPFELQAAEDALFYKKNATYIASKYYAPEGSNVTSLVLVNATHIKAMMDAMNSLEYAKIAPFFTIAGKAYATQADLGQRQAAVKKWNAAYGHLIISQGPYMMTGFNPQTGAITLKAFRDSTYPFKKGAGITTATTPTASPTNTNEVCTKNGTALKMTYAQAVAIAQKSECTADGASLLSEHWCNDYTGSWWIKTSITKSGCSPTCMIIIETQQAEINWMCTGAR